MQPPVDVVRKQCAASTPAACVGGAAGRDGGAPTPDEATIDVGGEDLCECGDDGAKRNETAYANKKLAEHAARPVLLAEASASALMALEPPSVEDTTRAAVQDAAAHMKTLPPEYTRLLPEVEKAIVNEQTPSGARGRRRRDPWRHARGVSLDVG